MSFLLDTHILLWFLENDSKLSTQVREVIINPKNIIFVSAISAWEISIKQSLGKLIAPNNLEEALRFSRLEVLAMKLAHAIKVADLPMHHKDPFDRMLIAQALVEGLTIITVDHKFKLYDVPLLIIA
ncbi:type II toxin-antitoxin system VapC family toxin [Anabaenopsis tanganyikae CS-531]|jgi:PIN domain nuclease of toxin-antitoxin system|uniref:Type II toxin-antitoxin system VapC family toxin n=2 Tax=Anabaenopsis TaxID=110103 RepID=A0ABT5AMH8_9CYAN|nr:MULTISPECIES: type II toxin-antitoxin system VapC family toxin [Anabaenopsis]MDB9538499.1 type II toxin-antitoxin system VapC family toxin [Anabaenopsis arnoldii]MDH6090772.1 type II toxin-antitoxin system VapC family toxin [Anabaenopsis arnoldii]MDH6098695.1 type II toxin-antitoxin system VapC family toxin [Anabaenopsis sp. FSS-46]MDH6106735.1 type II toxin-antitoxin system VapC family toxin [Anabaenopsis tanganyikae CS-531]